MTASPVPGEVYDAAILLLVMLTDDVDRRSLVCDFTGVLDWREAARDVLMRAAEGGVARVCVG